MKKLLSSLLAMLGISAIISVSAFAAESIVERAINVEPYRYRPTLTDTDGKISNRYSHKHENIGFVAKRLDSDISQDIWIELGESTTIYTIINPVGSRVICTSNQTGGGYTFEGCHPDKEYQWRAGKCEDTDYDVDCLFLCGSTSSSEFNP